KGGGGGLADFQKPSASTSVTANVSAHVAAQLVQAGGKVSITSTSGARTVSYADNTGGGFVHLGSSSASGSLANTTPAYVGTDKGGGNFDASGVKILAGGNFELSAGSSLDSHVNSSSDGGGVIAAADATSTGNVSGPTHVIVGKNADVEANSVKVFA